MSKEITCRTCGHVTVIDGSVYPPKVEAPAGVDIWGIVDGMARRGKRHNWAFVEDSTDKFCRFSELEGWQYVNLEESKKKEGTHHLPSREGDT